MGGNRTILVVDDDPHIREIVGFALRKDGFDVLEARDGDEALEIYNRERPDLLVLDILMPEKDGTEVCREIRKTSSVPIVFLSSRDDEIDRIVGLEIGGDDYVTKPFSPRELVARVRAVLRRVSTVQASAKEQATTDQEPGKELPVAKKGVRSHGRLVVDLDRFDASWDGTSVVLTATEFGLLRTLLGFPGKVFSRGELMDGAYGYDSHVTDRTIDSHIRRLRRKLMAAGGDPIETVHGVGYRLGTCE